MTATEEHSRTATFIARREMPLETRAVLEEFLYGAPLKATRRKMRWAKIKKTLWGV